MSEDPGGRRLGRYHLGDTLGGGPTGVVYLAKVLGVGGFERQFAIKRLHDELVSSPAMAAKVAGAARTYGGLEHPNIARLHEFGVADGETFTATELVDGVDLRVLAPSLKSGLLHGGAAAALAIAARAVAFAHERGHSHLGICPTNILVTKTGDLKITDFGMLPPRLPARPAQDPTLDSRIPFLAPEQLASEPTSAATDVFQLGVIGYLLFTGAIPFSATSAFEIAQNILSGNFPEPSLPKAISRVLRRCLARSPFERYPDAAALAEAIDEAAKAAAVPGSVEELGAMVASEQHRLSQIPNAQRDLAAPAPPPSGTKNTRPSAPAKLKISGPGKQALKKTMMGVGAELPRNAALEFNDQFGREPEVPLGPAGGEVRKTDDASPEPLALGKSGPARIGTAEETITAVRESSDAMDRQPTADMTGLDDDATEVYEIVDDQQPPLQPPGPPSPAIPTPAPAPPIAASRPVFAGGQAPPPATLPSAAAPPLSLPGPSSLSPTIADVEAMGAALKTRSSRGLITAATVAALVGAGGFVAYKTMLAPAEESAEQGAGAGTEQGAEQGAGAGTEQGAGAEQGGNHASAPADASTPPGQATEAAKPPPPEPSATLSIATTPEGAKIYLDGSAIGTTPFEMDGTNDKHRLALILAGYKLYVAEVDGHGTIAIDLEEVTPSAGAAGIKVRCKKKNRYYVFIDGEDAGQLCPTERIGVSKGQHSVEIYDPITDSRSAFKAKVEKTNRSHRVYVD